MGKTSQSASTPHFNGRSSERQILTYSEQHPTSKCDVQTLVLTQSTESAPSHKYSPDVGSSQPLLNKDVDSSYSDVSKLKCKSNEATVSCMQEHFQMQTAHHHKRQSSQSQSVPLHPRLWHVSSASLPSQPTSLTPENLRTHNFGGSGDGAQLVHFSSCASLSSPSQRSDTEEIHRIQFTDSAEECFVHVRGFVDGGIRLKPAAALSQILQQDKVVVLPVCGPGSGNSPYNYSLSTPLSIVVSSGTLSGFGMFATVPIRKGAVILAERPVMIVGETEDAGDVFMKLKQDTRNLVESFSDSTSMSHQGGEMVAPRTFQGILQTNGFGVELIDASGDKQRCRALFLRSARCNHSCGPSAIATFDPTSFVLTLHANRDIDPGDEITISYLPISSSSAIFTSIPWSLPESALTASGAKAIPPAEASESVMGYATSSSVSTTSSLFSCSSSISPSVPSLYLPRHSRRQLLRDSFHFECRCQYCDIPWSEVDGVRKSDHARKELSLYNLALSDPSNVELRKKLGIPTFEEWCSDSRISWDSLIEIHMRLLTMREAEGLELTGLAHPTVSGASRSGTAIPGNSLVNEQGWLKHADVLGMCFGALKKENEFREWVEAVRDVRWAMSSSGYEGQEEQVVLAKILDSWLDEPGSFPLWGWRTQINRH
ncbi:hypothetical protein K435DRAFT_848689 [Dendrothele bispora CBS 962.96]|uniref:SET domain-containing protein n=1 Tax=Dendrothele bispora (strain CBS 962.96) TaxID=1314807 RepID=A0A4S8MWB0_DENBC|nr:hypothetical protein K435DRAFT_848689 [Dendrothele bispora CBS 962.96]